MSLFFQEKLIFKLLKKAKCDILYYHYWLFLFVLTFIKMLPPFVGLYMTQEHQFSQNNQEQEDLIRRVRNGSLNYLEIPARFANNLELHLEVIGSTPSFYPHLSKELRNNPQIIEKAFHDIDYAGNIFYALPEEYHNNFDFIHNVISKNPEAYCYLTSFKEEPLIYNIFLKKSYKANIKNIPFIVKDNLDNFITLLETLLENPFLQNGEINLALLSFEKIFKSHPKLNEFYLSIPENKRDPKYIDGSNVNKVDTIFFIKLLISHYEYQKMISETENNINSCVNKASKSYKF